MAFPARSLILAAIIACAALGSACQPLIEGQGSLALLEVVVENPPPEMLVPPSGSFCIVEGGDQPIYTILKELSMATGAATAVEVVARSSGVHDLQANTCTFSTLVRWRFGPRYRAVATNGSDWVASCDQFLQFFVVPPARHRIRFALGQEGCAIDVVGI
jgi:hypothetical protein